MYKISEEYCGYKLLTMYCADITFILARKGACDLTKSVINFPKAEWELGCGECAAHIGNEKFVSLLEKHVTTSMVALNFHGQAYKEYEGKEISGKKIIKGNEILAISMILLHALRCPTSGKKSFSFSDFRVGMAK